MDTRYFREFITLCEYKNFTRAAEELYITQSSLSKHMKAIEEELGGIALFDNNSRRFALTEYGRYFLEIAKQIDKLNRDLVNEAARHRSDNHQPIKLLGINTMWEYEVCRPIFDWTSDASRTPVDIELYNEHLMCNILMNGAADLAIMRGPYYNNQELEKIVLTRDNIGVILPVNHPTDDDGTVRIEQLADDKFIRRGSLSALQKMTERICEDAGISPQFSSGVIRSNVYMLSSMVADGIGIVLYAKTPATRGVSYYSNKVKFCILKPEEHIDLCLVYHKNVLKRKEIRAFVDYLVSSGRTL